MVFADSIFDITNNVTRFLVLLELLRIEYPPVQAATIASLIASSFAYLAINLIVRRIHVFQLKEKDILTKIITLLACNVTVQRT